jgi:hypothetical protein
MREKIGEPDCRGITDRALAIDTADHECESIADPLALYQSFPRSKAWPKSITRFNATGNESAAFRSLGDGF